MCLVCAKTVSYNAQVPLNHYPSTFHEMMHPHRCSNTKVDNSVQLQTTSRCWCRWTSVYFQDSVWYSGGSNKSTVTEFAARFGPKQLTWMLKHRRWMWEKCLHYLYLPATLLFGSYIISLIIVQLRLNQITLTRLLSTQTITKIWSVPQALIAHWPALLELFPFHSCFLGCHQGWKQDQLCQNSCRCTSWKNQTQPLLVVACAWLLFWLNDTKCADSCLDRNT